MDDVSTVEGAATVAEAPVMSGWKVDVTETLTLVVLALLSLGVRSFVKWLKDKADLSAAEQEAMQCLLEGMSKAQDTLVRAAKTAAADGKLTQAEIQNAQQIALAHAKEIATGPAKDIIASWSARRASSLIKQLLSKLKSGKKGAANGDNTSDPVAANPTNS